MKRKILIDTLGWGFLLWLLGYGLGILLFTLVSPSLIGWIITPIGTLVTLFVLFKKIQGNFNHYIAVAISWTIIAIVFDYFFLVQAFKPADGYYKLPRTDSPLVLKFTRNCRKPYLMMPLECPRKTVITSVFIPAIL